ncbi:hypothetical protein GOODEAATRI_001263 [Goodea atripinnis]|uniref:BAR domain-containing protein n=1 Tax=Goodea atripinnis TaxID=208336 RepID=A0ABV0N9A5_9TELE
MPGIEKLPLEETLEDSPQTRSLLGVFEEDTAAVSNYCTQLYQAMQRIYDAQMFFVFTEILTLKEVFQIASDDHDAAINRYSRLSKRKDNDKVRAEVVEDVYTSRKKQHQTMMHYFCALNTLQYKKKTALLEPLLGYMQAQVCAHTHCSLDY